MIKNQKKRRERKRYFAVLLSGILVFTTCLVLPKGKTQATGNTDTELQNPVIVMNDCDTVYFGNYWQEDTNGDGVADHNDEKTPIRWRIMSQEGNDAYVIADQVLDAKPYNEEYKEVTWENCTLRKWLNEDFYYTAFLPEEQTAVLEQTVENADNKVYGTYGGNSTKDKVFLLSLEDALNTGYGFSSDQDKLDSARIGTATDYAKEQWAAVNGEMGCAWWLRSVGNNHFYASFVQDCGAVFSGGSNVDDFSVGIRPAMHLDLSSSYVQKAGKQNVSVKCVEWDTVEFGRYENGPILWRVLEVSDGTALLLADRILTFGKYNDTNEDVTWKECSLRKWLNGYFYENAFSDEEKAGIIQNIYENNDNGWFGTEGGEATQDRITLLSLEDSVRNEYGFPTYYYCDSISRRSCDKGGWNEFGLGNAWWLRSSGEYGNNAAWILGDGVVYHQGEVVDFSSGGIRPVLKVSLLDTFLEKEGNVVADESGVKYKERQQDDFVTTEYGEEMTESGKTEEKTDLSEAGTDTLEGTDEKGGQAGAGSTEKETPDTRTTEADKVEQTRTEAAILESVTTETAKTEAAAPESVTTETAKTEAAAPESVTTEMAKTEAAAPESVTTETAKTEAAAPESVTTETAKTEAATPESVTTEMAKTETIKPQTGTTEADKSQIGTTETANIETTTEIPKAVLAPAKPSLKSVTNKALKKLAVKWKKAFAAEGYEVSIATKKNFKSGKKVKQTKKTAYTFTKLKKGKTYYVRVRAYQMRDGEKMFGKYSAVKKIKITK